MSISYELAKELKEVGFPQGKDKVATFPELVSPIGYYISPEKKYGESTLSQEIVYVPTLEEAIEACRKIYSITRANDDEWEASTGYFAEKEEGGYINKEFNRRGKTPLEAVLRLWLAINKK